jgi:prepilin-type N-terminal cleavage/methylation domain-containing protein
MKRQQKKGLGIRDWGLESRRRRFLPSPLSSLPSPLGFTLVELLVVITIIGILAGLITAAAIHASVHAKNFVIYNELKQLEMALQAYKEKFGEYPPDFAFPKAGYGGMGNATTLSEQAVIRHLAKAFPRYTPGLPSGVPLAQQNTFGGFVNDVTFCWGGGTRFSPDSLSPMSALIFWLGGMPILDASGNVTGFQGFSANPLNPFDASPSRIKPFFDFDLQRVGGPNPNAYPFQYWPQGAVGNKTSGAIVYFRAENGAYTFVDNTKTPPVIYSKWVVDFADPAIPHPNIYPAVDDRLCNVTVSPRQYTWVNPQSVQIFSSGLDVQYSTPVAEPTFYPTFVAGNLTTASSAPPSPPNEGPYEFPHGRNYNTQGHTYDDITNFSGGTLESNIP